MIHVIINEAMRQTEGQQIFSNLLHCTSQTDKKSRQTQTDRNPKAKLSQRNMKTWRKLVYLRCADRGGVGGLRQATQSQGLRVAVGVQLRSH